MIYLCIIVLSVQFDLVWSTRYSRCFLSVSLVVSCLVLIKDYYLSLRPRLRVPASSSCVHRDRRPDPTVSSTPSPRFVLFVFSSFYLFPVFCLSALMPADRGRYPPPAVAIPSPPAGSLVLGLPLPQARRSREIMPAGPPQTQARRIAADSSPPSRC